MRRMRKRGSSWKRRLNQDTEKIENSTTTGFKLPGGPQRQFKSVTLEGGDLQMGEMGSPRTKRGPGKKWEKVEL